MKIKSLLIFVFTLMSLTAFAQSGGIKGKVVSREGRVAVDGVKVSVTPGEMTATTDGRGGFGSRMSSPANIRCSSRLPNSSL